MSYRAPVRDLLFCLEHVAGLAPSTAEDLDRDTLQAVLEAKPVPALMPGPGSEDANGVPSPGSRGALGWARGVANRAFAETIPRA